MVDVRQTGSSGRVVVNETPSLSRNLDIDTKPAVSVPITVVLLLFGCDFIFLLTNFQSAKWLWCSFLVIIIVVIVVIVGAGIISDESAIHRQRYSTDAGQRRGAVVLESPNDLEVEHVTKGLDLTPHSTSLDLMPPQDTMTDTFENVGVS